MLGVLELRSLIYVLHPVTQHAVDQARQLGGHGLDRNGGAQLHDLFLARPHLRIPKLGQLMRIALALYPAKTSYTHKMNDLAQGLIRTFAIIFLS